ncbi:MAG: ribbon-helix-helix protein, CopG family [Deltaproteobacteria bacterium]|nr:ribbon-helix-helix protein, CopG family [Deltaproteobacteria bacterium]
MEEWQYEALKALAERQGKSISEIVRQLLNDRLGKDEPSQGLARIRGIGSDAEASGREHDALLYGEE